MKIDLSKENILKTKMMNGTEVRKFKPKYSLIELIEMDKSGDINSLRMFSGIIPFSVVKAKFGHRKILSVHDYDDTRTTSICLEREYD